MDWGAIGVAAAGWVFTTRYAWVLNERTRVASIKSSGFQEFENLVWGTVAAVHACASAAAYNELAASERSSEITINISRLEEKLNDVLRPVSVNVSQTIRTFRQKATADEIKHPKMRKPDFEKDFFEGIIDIANDLVRLVKEKMRHNKRHPSVLLDVIIGWARTPDAEGLD